MLALALLPPIERGWQKGVRVKNKGCIELYECAVLPTIPNFSTLFVAGLNLKGEGGYTRFRGTHHIILLTFSCPGLAVFHCSSLGSFCWHFRIFFPFSFLEVRGDPEGRARQTLAEKERSKLSI